MKSMMEPCRRHRQGYGISQARMRRTHFDTRQPGIDGVRNVLCPIWDKQCIKGRAPGSPGAPEVHSHTNPPTQSARAHRVSRGSPSQSGPSIDNGLETWNEQPVTWQRPDWTSRHPSETGGRTRTALPQPNLLRGLPPASLILTTY